MTEAEWLECTHVEKILEFLAGKVSNRKLRLFACACCRRTEHLYPTKQRRKCLEVLERWADGLESVQEVGTAIGKSLSGWEPEREKEIIVRELIADTLLVFFDHPDRPREIASVASFLARDAVAMSQTPHSHDNQPTEERQQVSLMRDITGNLFRPTSIDTIIQWGSGTIMKLAQGIYEEKAFERMPILADALEEAGCTNADILSHLRGPGPHVRGCWVLDLLLGKQ